jgi:hypothetical protein
MGFHSISLDYPAYQIDGKNELVGSDVHLAGDQATDYPDVGGKRVAPGTVVVKKDADGLYYLADDAANGDRNTAPSITSAGHADGNGVIKIVGNHGTISVTTATGTGTEANNATDLNADTAFKAHYIASSAGGELTIAARATGKDEWFYVHSDTMATAGLAEGDANAERGTSADYRVVRAHRDTVDLSGASFVDRPVNTLLAGHFRESELRNLTQEAKAVLAARGSLFG